MNETVSLLCDLIRYPSTSGREQEVMKFVAQAFEPVVDSVELVSIPPDIVRDPDYANPLPAVREGEHWNVVAAVRGSGGGRSLIINTHADVVPPSEGQLAPFDPVFDGESVHGRGACDAKGQVATIWRALKQLRAEGVRPKGDIVLHIVAEEESGGNGSLALVRNGRVRADAVLVAEPTDLKIVATARGAVWFRITCTGRPGHVGSPRQSVSALKSAVAVIQILEAYHDRLLAQSRGMPLYDQFEDPMPIVFGMLHAGSWPATVPGQAVLEGVLGFLPNMTKEQVAAEMREAIVREGDPWLRENFALEFTFRHDPYVTSPDSPLVTIMKQAVDSLGELAIVSALPASSDAWFYSNQLKIPTITFGPGKLGDAHTSHERISVADLERGSDILVAFIKAYVQ